jgi:uncharacterized protein YndB with AHSA1/START domain
MKPCYFDFEIDREFACSPAVLFDSWSDAKVKAKWFVGPDKWVETGRSVDLREGGTETMTGHFDGAFTTEYTAHFYDVQLNSRLGFSFEVRLGGEIYSISTAVVEFIETSRGAAMKYHEQLAVFSGQPIEEARSNRIDGTDQHFKRLTALLQGSSDGGASQSSTPGCHATELRK